MTTKKDDGPLGLYIHIPFCHARCGYCDFVTFTGKEDRIDQYIEDLFREIRLHPQRLDVSTIFFGGGTPSLLDPRHVSDILRQVRSHFDLNSDAEITLEANPESVTREKAAGWREAGINRLSLGLQAFDDGLLKKMDRLHNVPQFLDAYQAVREAGFSNVSVDLIYGFAEQTLEDWKKTLLSTVAIQPDHLSLYALKIEEHTPFAARGYRVNDDQEVEMYEWARAYLKDAGFKQYEISNFSRPGKACRHNLIYWRQQDYLGLGVGAVGCVDGLRWENHKNLNDYHRDISARTWPRAGVENLDPGTRRFECLMLGLRLREGFRWPESSPEWLAHRASLAARGLLEEVRPGQWRIPDAVVPLTNQVLLPFL
jgi:oxygen-independent coproporphyrinogen-3 oxidase